MNTPIINIDNQITNCLKLLNDQQKQALLTVAEAFIGNNHEDIYNDEFIAELDHRTMELENGSVQGYSWEEVKQKTREAVRSKRNEL